MNTDTLEDPIAPGSDDDTPSWRQPRAATLHGRDAIIAGAHHLDAVTRYAGAAGALAERGLGIAPSGGEDRPGPAITVGGTPYGLTQDAATALFQRLGLSVRHIAPADASEDTTRALVDAACASAYGHRQLASSRLVLDDEEKTVCGVVSAGYTPIAHARLAEGMRLDEPASATVRGTTLQIRDGRGHTFVARNPHQRGADKVRIHITGTNSSAGETAFAIGTYIYRSICRNGLMGLVQGDRFRAEHRGNAETLEPAIARILAEAETCIEKTRELIGTLVTVSLTPASIAANSPACEALASSLETLRARPLATELRTASRANDTAAATDCVHRMIAETGPREARAVLESPYRQGEATAWDLVNLASAAARQIHGAEPALREDAEQAAGKLGRTLIAQRRALAART